jgi:16S rRNA (uracil1498-N3)-methyltransferase
MARPNRNNRKHKNHLRSGHPRKRLHPQPHVPVARSRYDAPGDEPLAIASRLTLQEPFRIDRALVKRLERREVNPKEAFTIRDESAAWFRASLKECNADRGLALPYERMDRSPEPTIDITLACAVLARQRMLFVMQKATELGVMRIVPLLTDHSVPPEGLQHENAHAWPGHVTRAAKQCRRGSLPQVLPPMPFDSLLVSPVFTAADLCLFLDDRSEPAPHPPDPPRRIVLLVGPEGGFSDAERAKLAGKARPWVLGGRVLRAETAVIVGLTAVHLTWGDFTNV